MKCSLSFCCTWCWWRCQCRWDCSHSSLPFSLSLEVSLVKLIHSTDLALSHSLSFCLYRCLTPCKVNTESSFKLRVLSASTTSGLKLLWQWQWQLLHSVSVSVLATTACCPFAWPEAFPATGSIQFWFRFGDWFWFWFRFRFCCRWFQFRFGFSFVFFCLSLLYFCFCFSLVFGFAFGSRFAAVAHANFNFRYFLRCAPNWHTSFPPTTNTREIFFQLSKVFSAHTRKKNWTQKTQNEIMKMLLKFFKNVSRILEICFFRFSIYLIFSFRI